MGGFGDIKQSEEKNSRHGYETRATKLMNKSETNYLFE